MIDRKELKSRAKSAMKKGYWWIFLACIIVGILGGKGGSGFSNSNYNSKNNIKYYSTLDQNENNGFTNYTDEYNQLNNDPINNTSEDLGLLGVFALIFLIILLLVFIYKIFIGNAIIVGFRKFMLGTTEETFEIGTMFSVFKNNYKNAVKTMFFKDLYIFLWSLLLIIPGIIKSYEYYMVDFILADNPETDKETAFKMSKEMMDGYKWDTFVLHLSFIGWYFLGVLLLGIGVLFVNPYFESTVVQLYLELSGKNQVQAIEDNYF